MKALKLIVPVAILSAGFLISTTASYGKPEYSKKEKKACTVCHVATGKKDLSDVGKCYAKNGHSLEKCEQVKK